MDRSSPRVLFPLWAKLGALFGGVVGALILVWGYGGFRAELAEESAERQARLIGAAATLAGALPGDEIDGLRTRADEGSVTYGRVRRALGIAREANGLSWTGVSRQTADGYAFVVDGGEVPVPIGYPIFDGFAARARVIGGETVYVESLEDEWGTWDIALAPVLDTEGSVVAMVEVTLDAGAIGFFEAARLRGLLVVLGLAVVLAVGVAVMFARYVNRNLSTLTHSALAVADGRLDTLVDIRSRDELGLLGRAFNTMVRGLRDRERIRETFGRFVDPSVVAHVLHDQEALLRGDRRRVTVLMSDLRGFTALSEELGPEAMVELLNRYLTAMSEAITPAGGNLSELVGDGIVVLFGAPDLHDDDPVRACRCAVQMHQALRAFNEREGRALEMGIGIATGPVVAGQVGSADRMKYGVVGAPINLAARLEGFTIGNQILIDANTHHAAPDALLGDVQQIKVKGRREPVRCWPLLGIGDAVMPPTSLPRWRRVDLPATVWAVEGKQVATDGVEGRVVAVASSRIQLDGPSAPMRAVLKIGLEGTEAPMYGTVVEDGDALVVHLTSMPQAARVALEAAAQAGPSTY